MNYEKLTARIISGTVPIKVYHGGKFRRFHVRRPSRMDILELEEIYEDALAEAEANGQMTEDELEAFLWEEGLWDEKRENALVGIPKDIEKLKVGLFEKRHDLDILQHTRKLLASAKRKYNELFQERYAHDITSCLGYARMTKLQARLAMGLYEGDERVFPNLSYLDDMSDLMQNIISAWSSAQLEEHVFRAIARNVPWRPIWQARESSGSLFGIAACDYTEDQQQLVAASQLYEQIRQHPDCPPEYVLNDDDMLDGWLILEHRKQAGASNEQDVESTIRNQNIKSSQEVFKIVGKNKEFAEKVDAMNTDGARKTIEKRFSAIEAKGKVSIQNLPDMKQRILMEKNNAQ